MTRNVCRKTRHANQNFTPRKYSCPRWNKRKTNEIHFELIQLKCNTSQQFVFSVTFQNKSPLKVDKEIGKGNKLEKLKLMDSTRMEKAEDLSHGGI